MNGIHDFWIIKLNSSGNVTWQRLFGGDSYDIAFDIQETSNGGYILTGHSASSNTGTLVALTNHGVYDYWILKLDDSGNIIWQSLLGGTESEFPSSIRPTSDGGCIVAGYANAASANTGTLLGLLSSGGTDYWILKLDNSGVVSWQKLIGGTSDDKATSLQQTSDGGFIVTGYSYSNNSGTLLGLINNGGTDIWTLKLDGSGNFY